MKRCEVCLGIGTIHDARFGAVECPSCGGRGQLRRLAPLLVKALVYGVLVLSPVWIEGSRVFADIPTNPHLPVDSCTGM